MLGEPELLKVKVGDIIQLQRRGFFRVDVAPSPPSAHTSRRAPLVLFHVPDGHTKEMPGQVSDFDGTVYWGRRAAGNCSSDQEQARVDGVLCSMRASKSSQHKRRGLVCRGLGNS